MLAAGTLLFTLAKPLATLPLFIWVVFPIVLAVANALLWAAWGEFYTRKRSTFAVGKFALVYGSVMLAAMIMSLICKFIRTLRFRYRTQSDMYG